MRECYTYNINELYIAQYLTVCQDKHEMNTIEPEIRELAKGRTVGKKSQNKYYVCETLRVEETCEGPTNPILETM